jgi:hypothetical protein
MTSSSIETVVNSVVSQTSAGRNTLKILVSATLATSAVHFIDNAFRLDLYPGPAWLTRSGILLAWLVLPVLALAAYWSANRAALIAYGLLGFAGFAHYLPIHRHPVPLRCFATIFAEALASAALIVFVVFRGTALSQPAVQKPK